MTQNFLSKKLSPKLINSKLAAQFYYGYRELILEYLSLDRQNLILGSFQHGEGPTEIVRDFIPSPRIHLQRLPLYVSSQLAARELEDEGFRVKAIGSPILYAFANQKKSFAIEDDVTAKKLSPTKVLIVPSHTRIYGNNSVDELGIKLLIKNYRELAGDSQGTLLLYHTEFLSREWRKYAKSYDFQVECAGLGNTEPKYLDIRQRTDFFYNLISILSEAETVYIEGLSSAIHYSIFMNKDTRVILNEDYLKKMSPKVSSRLRWYKEFVPGLFDGKTVIDSAQRRQIFNNLGVRNFPSRESLNSQLVFVRSSELLWLE